MKKLLTLAIVLASTSAFATRARLQALGNAPHIDDTASVYVNPADIFVVGDSATIETGSQDLVEGTDAANEGAEALVIRSAGNAKWAFSLGHDDAGIYARRSAAFSGTVDVAAQQNPFELTYGMKNGDMAWAGTLVYSNFNNKLTEVKETSTALRFGANTSSWDASVDLGLVDKWESGTTVNDEYKGKSNVVARGGYWASSDLYAHATVAMYGYEVTDSNTVTKEVKQQIINIGAINTMKNDGNEFFWGAGLESSSSKDSKATGTTTEKTTALYLPFIIGLEANAASWLTLRGSIEQNVMIQDDKTTAANGTTNSETAPGTNSTTFAAGAGLKLGKLSLDGTILKDAAGTNSQKLNGNELLSQVGMTYTF
jgi:hypothetical protein